VGELLASGVSYGVGMVAEALHKYVLVPIGAGIVSTVRALWHSMAFIAVQTHAHLLLPGWHSACHVVVSLWGGACSLAAGVLQRMLVPLHRWTSALLGGIARGVGFVGSMLRRGASAAADLVHRCLLVPLGHFLSYAGYVITYTIDGIWLGLCGVGTVLHSRILVPLYHGTVAALASIAHGATSIVIAVWNGGCALINGVCGYALLPLYHGAATLVNGVVNGAACVARGLWHGACTVVSGLHSMALVPLYHGAAALVNGVVNGVACVSRGLWHGACTVVSGLHSVVLVPLYHGLKACGKGIGRYLILPAYSGMAALLRGLARAVAFVGDGLRTCIVLPLYHWTSELVRGLASGLATTCKLGHRHVVKPVCVAAVSLGAAVTMVAVAAMGSVSVASSAIYHSVLVPIGGAAQSGAIAVLWAVSEAARVMRGVTAASASAISEAVAAAVSTVEAMAQAVAGMAQSARGTVSDAVNTVGGLFHVFTAS